MPGPRVGLQELPAILNHQLAVILAQVANVGILERNANLVREPSVGLLPGHAAGFVELVEVVVGRAPERAELVIGEATHGDVGARVNLHIGVALRIPATDVQHSALTVLTVNTVGAPQDDWAAAIGATHPLRFIFWAFMFTHIEYLQSKNENKKAGRCKEHRAAWIAGDPEVFYCSLPALSSKQRANPLVYVIVDSIM